MTSLNWRRRLVQRLINEDPWDFTVIRAEPVQETPLQLSLTGRLFSYAPVGEGNMPSSWGEVSVGVQGCVAIFLWDATALKPFDSITAVHTASGISRKLKVAYVDAYPYKQEVRMEEQQ